MYENTMTSVMIPEGLSPEFPIRVDLHQEYTLNPYLFVLVIDKFTRYIQDRIP